MKLLTIPKADNILNNIDKVDGIIIGLKDYSVTYDIKLDINQIKQLKSKINKEIYVVINKAIFNEEVSEIGNIIKELDEININGVLFYDQSILSLTKKLGLKIPLIWHQTHMVTNYNTCNYYYEQGVYGAYLSNEITLNEMIDIKKNSQIKIFANIIYRPVMSFTRRSLLTNYFKSFGKNISNNKLEIYEKITDKKYLVKEEKDGTSIIYSNIINGIEPLFEMLKNNFEYVIIDETYLEDNNIIKIVRDVIDNNYDDKKEVVNKVNSMIGTDTGFFYKETIYKVKGEV